MVRLIVGQRGKGKTTSILAHVNEQIKKADGNIVYLDKSSKHMYDKSSKHMYDLNNKIRLIDVSRYPISNSEQFVGFVCGIISQDNDLEQMYLDSFIKLSSLEGEDIEHVLTMIDSLSKKYHVDFILSISRDAHEIPEAFKENIIVSL